MLARNLYYSNTRKGVSKSEKKWEGGSFVQAPEKVPLLGQ